MRAFLIGTLGLPPWLILLVAGLVTHIVLNRLLRKPLTSPWGLLAPLLLGIGLEVRDIWLSYGDVGLFAPANDPLLTILTRHSVDVALMLALPATVVAAGITGRKSGR